MYSCTRTTLINITDAHTYRQLYFVVMSQYHTQKKPQVDLSCSNLSQLDYSTVADSCVVRGTGILNRLLKVTFYTLNYTPLLIVPSFAVPHPVCLQYMGYLCVNHL